MIDDFKAKDCKHLGFCFKINSSDQLKIVFFFSVSSFERNLNRPNGRHLTRLYVSGEIKHNFLVLFSKNREIHDDIFNDLICVQ